jgi:hypothetical protein
MSLRIAAGAAILPSGVLREVAQPSRSAVHRAQVSRRASRAKSRGLADAVRELQRFCVAVRARSDGAKAMDLKQ